MTQKMTKEEMEEAINDSIKIAVAQGFCSCPECRKARALLQLTDENAALAKRLEAAEEAWREYRAMECAFDTLVPNREGWVEKLSEYADELEAIRQKVESAFAAGALK